MMAKTFIALFILFNVANAVLPGTWPLVDRPVSAVPEWNSLVDMSKVPKAPLYNQTVPCTQVPPDNCRYICSCPLPEDIRSCPTKKDWALSFDDGPSPYTSRLVDFLNSQNIKATFFVVGSRVYEHPDILKKIHDSGHNIGVHTWSHWALTGLSNEQIIAEIKYTELAIQEAIGVTTRTLRAPYGEFDNRVRAIIAQLGYKMILWDRDPSDFLANNNPSFNLNWIPGNFSQWISDDSASTNGTGHISLEHDLYQVTALAAEGVVPVLKKAQYNFVTAAGCNNIDSYTKSVVPVPPPSTNPVTPPVATANTYSNTDSNTASNTASNTTSTTSSATTSADAATPASLNSDSSQSNAASLDKSIASLFTTCLLIAVSLYQTFL